MNKIKERPVILSTDEVRDILDNNKTQIRAPIKHLKELVVSEGRYSNGEEGSSLSATFLKPVRGKRGVFTGGPFTKDELLRWFARDYCYLGKIGDRLWVRETTLKVEHLGWSGPVYVASEEGRTALDFGYGDYDDPDHIPACELKSRSPVAMPRWASRLTLEITNLHAERSETEDWIWIVDFEVVENNQ